MNQDMQLRLVITADGKVAVTAVNQVTAAEKALADQQRANTAQTRATTNTAGEYVDALRRQVRELQLSKAEMREYDAVTRGATQAQISEIRALGAQLDANAAKTATSARFSTMLANAMELAARASAVFAAVLAAAAPAAYFSKANDEARTTLSRINGITDSLARSRAVYAGLIDDATYLQLLLEDLKP